MALFTSGGAICTTNASTMFRIPSEIRPDNTRPRSVPGLPESRRRRRGRLNPDFVGKIVMLAPSQHELKVFLLVARTKT